MKKIAIVASMCLCSWITTFAQQDTTMNRTVIVENEYNPTVMDASKINVMPKIEEPKAAKKNIDYATSLRPVSSWNYQAMSPVVREWEADKAYRGYFRAGYGNNGSNRGMPYRLPIRERPATWLDNSTKKPDATK